MKHKLCKTYKEAVEYLYSLIASGTKYELKKISFMADLIIKQARLEQGPNFKTPPYIQIIGTNGKGSVSRMVSSGFMACGIKTGLFTSPHLTVVRERFAINNEPISEELFINAVNDIMPIVQACIEKKDIGCPSFFETVCAAGYSLFLKQGCKALVFEAGLGGRLDATSAFKSSVTVLTNIDYDHTKTLGSTLKSIALEKIGALSSPLICNDPRKYIRSLVKKAVNKMGQKYIKPDKSSLNLINQNRMTLPGDHQLENAVAAISVFKFLKKSFKCTENFINMIDLKKAAQGIEKTTWSGRLEQFLIKKDEANKIKKDVNVLLDCAHNKAGARALNKYLETIKNSYSAIHCIIGMLGDKDSDSLFSRVLPYAKTLVISKPKNWRSRDPLEQLPRAEKYMDKSKIEIISEVNEAFDHIIKRIKPNELLLICGSIYLVGEVRGYMLNIPMDPKVKFRPPQASILNN